MDDIQFQIVSNMIDDLIHIQITSGCDILVESGYRRTQSKVTKDFIRQELLRSFEYALDVKLDQIFKQKSVTEKR